MQRRARWKNDIDVGAPIDSSKMWQMDLEDFQENHMPRMEPDSMIISNRRPDLVYRRSLD